MGFNDLIDSRYFNSYEVALSDLELYYCGLQKCPPLHSNTRMRDFYVIHYILSGKGIFSINDTTYALSKGQGFLICPGILTSYQADAVDPWTYCWFSFSGIKIRDYLNQLSIDQHRPLFTYDSDNSLEECIMHMISAKKMTSGRNFYLQSQMYMFFYKLAEYMNAPLFTTLGKSIGEEYIKKAVEFIKTNYAERITIQELANYIGISRKHLFRIFKESLQLSPQKFLIYYRINKACELLDNSTLSIHDIAQSVGYVDPLLFSKVFKGIKSISPREYRRLHWEKSYCLVDDIPEY